MDRMRRLALCLVATSAVALVVAGPAAALPQFWQNGTAIGAGVKKEFWGTTGEAVLKTAAPHKVACTAGLSIGETNGPEKVAKLGLWFIGCKETVSGASCHSTVPEGSEGEIITQSLSGVLGYLKMAAPVKAGLLLNPGEGPITKIQCGALEGEVRGSVIGEVKPLNTQQNTWEDVFSEVAEAQQWTKFEGEAGTRELEAFTEPAWLITTYKATWSGSEKLEIKA